MLNSIANAHAHAPSNVIHTAPVNANTTPFSKRRLISSPRFAKHNDSRSTKLTILMTRHLSFSCPFLLSSLASTQAARIPWISKYMIAVVSCLFWIGTWGISPWWYRRVKMSEGTVRKKDGLGSLESWKSVLDFVGELLTTMRER